MNIPTLLHNIGIAVFTILAVIFGFLSLYAIKRDLRIPPNEARKKSLIKSTTYIFFCSVSSAFLAGLLTPNSTGTVIFCIIASIVFLGIYLGIMLLQYRLLERLGLDKKFEVGKSKEDPTDSKEEEKK